MKPKFAHAAAFLLGVGCAKAPTGELPAAPKPSLTTPSSGAHPADVRADVVAPQTALLTVLLHPDGRLEITGMAVKPVAYRGRHLVPFQPAVHQVTASLPASPRSTGTALRNKAVPSPGPTALVVRAPRGDQSFVVPVELGTPGEGGGDVADRWADSTVILRAPYLGEGTQFSVLRQTAQGPVELGTWGPQ